MRIRTASRHRGLDGSRRGTLLAAVVGAFAILATVVVAGAGPAMAGTVAEDAQTATRDILFPVVGDYTYSDTFGACRSGCSRGHEGTDIMADKLTELVAVRDAEVSWLKDTATPDGSNGNYLMLRDDEGWEYWYIHINNDSPGTDDGANPPEWIFGPGIERGAEVTAGQLVGYVGDSGNAEWTAPHLHFEIHKPDGSVINPYKSLQAAEGLTEPVDPDEGLEDTPEGRFAAALFRDFLDRDGELDEIRARAKDVASDGRSSVVRDFARSDEWVAALIDSYYVSTLGRPADAKGRAYWIEQLQGGLPPADAAAYFFASDEYFERAGGENEAWVRDLYAELLFRRADDSGVAFWVGLLEEGTSRPDIAADFYASLESRRARVTGLYGALLDRDPDERGRDYWAEVLTNGQDLDLAMFLASSDEYFARAQKR